MTITEATTISDACDLLQRLNRRIAYRGRRIAAMDPPPSEEMADKADNWTADDEALVAALRKWIGSQPA